MARLTLRWKVVADAGRSFAAGPVADLFLASENPGFFHQFGKSMSTAYSPLSLQPTRVYHQAIAKLLRRKLGVRVEPFRFPYVLPLAGLGDCAVTIRFRVFPPRIASLTITAKPVVELGRDLDVDLLVRSQLLPDLRPLDAIVRWSLGMLAAGSKSSFSPADRYAYKPAVNLDDVAPEGELERYVEAHRRELTATVIRAQDHRALSQAIVDQIAAKNERHNLKTGTEHVFVDKQGALRLAAASPDRDREGWRFARLFDLFELALVGRVLLDAEPRTRDVHARLLEVVRAWTDTPERVLHESVSTRLFWSDTADELKLGAGLAGMPPPQEPLTCVRAAGRGGTATRSRSGRRAALVAAAMSGC